MLEPADAGEHRQGQDATDVAAMGLSPGRAGFTAAIRELNDGAAIFKGAGAAATLGRCDGDDR